MLIKASFCKIREDHSWMNNFMKTVFWFLDLLILTDHGVLLVFDWGKKKLMQNFLFFFITSKLLIFLGTLVLLFPKVWLSLTLNCILKISHQKLNCGNYLIIVNKNILSKISIHIFKHISTSFQYIFQYIQAIFVTEEPYWHKK